MYGDTKYDLQNQQDQVPGRVTAYEQAISGDTKGDLPRAIAPAGDARSRALPRTADDAGVGADARPTTTRPTAGRSPPWAEAAVLAAFALGAAASWRAASTALPTWGCRGAQSPRERGRIAAPLPSAPRRPCPQCSAPRHQGASRHAHLAASWPAPARCASPSPPPPPPRTCATSATSTTPSAAVVAAGDTKSDLPGTVTATSPGDTKADLPGAIAPTPASHNTAVAPQADRAGDGVVRRRHERLAARGRDRGRAARRPSALGAAAVDDGPPAPRSPHGGVEERDRSGAGPRRGPGPHSVCVRNGRRPRAR